jgi:hypothetical protein
MFNWYRHAALCGACLSDVNSAEDPAIEDSPFTRSRWWTRGWTLQEFLAPSIVVFLASDWKEIGTRTTLEMVASRIIGISPFVMHNLKWRRCSAAQKMSWACRRTTTRVEDIAYCLMGLFDVDMPLLYGEGQKAFVRLQLEIWRQTADVSLLAWSMFPVDEKQTELFAISPRRFSYAAAVIAFDYLEGARYESRFEIVNEAVRIRARLLDFLHTIWFSSRSERFAQVTDTQLGSGKRAIFAKPNNQDFRRVYEPPVVIVPLRCQLNGVPLGILLGILGGRIYSRYHLPSLVAISTGHTLESKRIATIYAYISSPQHGAQLTTYEWVLPRLDISWPGIVAKNTRVLAQRDWYDDSTRLNFVLYSSSCPYGFRKYCFFVCAETQAKTKRLTLFSIGIYEDDFLTTTDVGTTIKSSNVQNYRLYSNSMNDERRLTAPLSEDLILVRTVSARAIHQLYQACTRTHERFTLAAGAAFGVYFFGSTSGKRAAWDIQQFARNEAGDQSRS